LGKNARKSQGGFFLTHTVEHKHTNKIKKNKNKTNILSQSKLQGTNINATGFELQFPVPKEKTINHGQ